VNMRKYFILVAFVAAGYFAWTLYNGTVQGVIRGGKQRASVEDSETRDGSETGFDAASAALQGQPAEDVSRAILRRPVGYVSGRWLFADVIVPIQDRRGLAVRGPGRGVGGGLSGGRRASARDRGRSGLVAGRLTVR